MIGTCILLSIWVSGLAWMQKRSEQRRELQAVRDSASPTEEEKA
jgi:hypothetical protein